MKVFFSTTNKPKNIYNTKIFNYASVKYFHILSKNLQYSKTFKQNYNQDNKNSFMLSNQKIQKELCKFYIKPNSIKLFSKKIDELTSFILNKTLKANTSNKNKPLNNKNANNKNQNFNASTNKRNFTDQKMLPRKPKR